MNQVFLLILCVGLAWSGFSWAESTLKEPVSKDYLDGRREALADIANDLPEILTTGCRMRGGQVDEETGLPTKNVPVGLSLFWVGYQDEVRKALKDGRLTGKTFKHKLMSEEEARSILYPKYEVLGFNDSGLNFGEEGRFSLSAECWNNSGEKKRNAWLFVLDRKTGERTRVGFVTGEAKVRSAHSGMTVIIEDDVVLATYDLERPIHLQLWRLHRLK